jgi:nitronate monooxygenase
MDRSTTKRGDRWSRRDLLHAGAAASVGSFGAQIGARRARGENRMLRTPLCDLLSIEVPLLQAPMSGVVTPPLVAAVANAGGLGILPGILVPPDELRAQIRAIRALTSRPFAVNLLLHTALLPPADPAAIPDDVIARVHRTLNRFRQRLGLPPRAERPPRAPDFVDAAFEVILAERVPVWSIGLGRPTLEQVERCHRQGTKVIAMAATVEDARELAASGVDVIVAQGSEAGGHRSTWTKRLTPQHAAVGTLALVPQVVAAVNVPVVAAGGIVDGRGVVAALALGAVGALLGTRFIATRESGAPAFYKDRLLKATSDDTVITDVFTGMFARVIRNEFTDTFAAEAAPVLPPFAQALAASDVTAGSAAQGSGEFYALYAGQGCGGVRDLPSAADLVRRTMMEAASGISALSAFARTGG